MPLIVFLSPTTASPPAEQVVRDIRQALAAEDARIDGDGVTLITTDNAAVQQVKGHAAWFVADRLSPSFCRILFRSALKANAVVGAGGSDRTPLIMAGSKARLPYRGVKTELVADPKALCHRLSGALLAWDRVVEDAQARGLLGPEAQRLGEPPTEPGLEPPVRDDASGVAKRCQSMAEENSRRGGWKIVSSSVSRNARFGVVWRSDEMTAGSPEPDRRTLCWRSWADGAYLLAERPLGAPDAAPSATPPP